MYLSQGLCCLSLSGLYRPYVCLPRPQCGLPCVVDYNKDCFCYSTSPAIPSGSVRDNIMTPVLN